MLGVADYGAFVAAIVLFLMIPGPGNLALITSTGQGGVRAGMAACAGVIAADQVLMWLAVAGMAALLAAHPAAFAAMQWLGAAYLAWLGCRMLLAKPGAAPVLIGWAAVTGSLDWPAVVVFGIVFCWQMPHFWALALRFKDDYAKADVPMLPVVTTALSVGRQAVAWAWATVVVSLLLWPVAAEYGIGLGYAIPAALLGGWFVVESHRLLRRIKRGGDFKPMTLFHVSISYLSLLSVAIIVDAIV